GTWLLIAEVAHQSGSGFFSDDTASYVTGGYRIGPVTPFVTYAQLVGDPRSDPGIPTAGMPPPLAQAASGLNAGLSSVLSATGVSQLSFGGGIRWDLFANLDLKL